MVTSIDGQGNGTVVVVSSFAEDVTISGFRIVGGYSDFAGGVAVEYDFQRGGRAIIRNNIVEYNRSIASAGGILAEAGSTVEDNIIQHNNQGGSKGVSALQAAGTIRRNTVRFNGAGSFQVVRISRPSIVENNVIVDNGFVSGSMMSISGGGSVVRNNTVANNSCGFGNRTIAIGGPLGNYEVTNNIIVFDACDGLWCGGGGTQVIGCNDVWGTIGSPYVGQCSSAGGSNGNFSADPLFCDAASGDYRLRPESPCAPANSPPGCGLIGALPVCGVTMVEEDSPVATLSLTIQPNPIANSAEFMLNGGLKSPTLEIFNGVGRLIEVIHPRGSRVRWTVSSEEASGVYMARLRANGLSRVVKFVVVR